MLCELESIIRKFNYISQIVPSMKITLIEESVTENKNKYPIVIASILKIERTCN